MLDSDNAAHAEEEQSKESLERELQGAGLLVMAILDQLNISEINVSQHTLISATGGLEVCPDIATGGYTIRRKK